MAFAENKANPINPGDLGLDRTRIDAEDKVQLISEPADLSKSAKDPPDWDTINGTDANAIHHGDDPLKQDQSPLSKRKRLSLTAKKVLHIGNDTINKPLPPAPILADAPQTESDSRLIHDSPSKPNDKLKDFVHDPVETVKSKVTGQGGHQVASNLAAKEISHGQEVELVRAHDRVARARTEKERLLAINNVDEMLAARQDMFVRWTMDRHITKVRKLTRSTVHLKDRKEFIVVGTDGKEKMDWKSYIIHVAEFYAEQYGGEYIGFTGDPPSPSKEVLVSSVERLSVSSAPFQELIMTIRRIYRWENRNETLRYLIGYSILWVLNLILPGFLAGLIYLIVHRKIHPPDIEDLRKDVIRTEDTNETALTLTEFIEKEGDQRWIDPLIDQVGPWLLVQLSDLANLMEVLRNFYEWRVPNRTGVSVGILSVALIAVTFAPLWLLVRATTLSLGIIYFCLFPISSRFPDYRLIASPVKWVFWKIPTHGEWAVKVLQAEGARHRQADNQKPRVTPDEFQDPDPLKYRDIPAEDDEPSEGFADPQAVHEKDYGSYKCRGGKLIITSTGVRFESGIGRSGHWVLRYQDVRRLEKITRTVQKKVGKDSGDDLRFVGPGGTEYVLLNMEKRNECFSQVVGFSDVTWQIVW